MVRGALGIFGGPFHGDLHSELADQKMFIRMNGKDVFKFAVKVIGESTGRALAKCGLTYDDVDLLIPHQANERIIQAAAKKISLPLERIFENLDRYGNTSSASIAIALDEAVHAGRIKSGDQVVLVGFGAGLTWASLCMEWR